MIFIESVTNMHVLALDTRGSIHIFMDRQTPVTYRGEDEALMNYQSCSVGDTNNSLH